jgi:hypothetical protein
VTYEIVPAQRPKRNSLAPPRWWWLPSSLLIPLAISGPNSVLGLYAITVLAFGLRLLWRPGEPPILAFIFFWQWMQSATGALYGNAIDVPIADLHFYRGRHEFASGLMLTGVLVLAFAMRAAAGTPRFDLHARIKALVLARPFRFWVRIYATTWVFSAVCEAIAPFSGGLRLPFLTMSDFKWAGFVLLTFAAFTSPNPSARTVWGWVFLIEFLLAIGGFFASFKEVFFYALFGLAASSVRFGPRILITGAVLAVTMLVFGVVWTGVKGEYRAFVNTGTGYQVVLVDHGERVARLGQLIGNLDELALRNAIDQLVSRVMYHIFFGAAADRVPSLQPHSNGEIWGEAIIRPLMPRLLFPNKRAVLDSDLTNQYTGLGVATAAQGTTISLGYMTEAYIDFGMILMFFPIAVLGAGVGVFYRWLLHQPDYKGVVGACVAPFALMPAHLAETSILKMIPSLILTLLASIVIIKILAPMVLRSLSRANPLDRS